MSKRDQSEENRNLPEPKTPRGNSLSTRLSRKLYDTDAIELTASKSKSNLLTSNRIRIEDTPTPLLIRKYSSIIDELIDFSNSPSAGPQIQKKIQPKIIPNTPAYSLTDHVVKKVFI